MVDRGARVDHRLDQLVEHVARLACPAATVGHVSPRTANQCDSHTTPGSVAPSRTYRSAMAAIEPAHRHACNPDAGRAPRRLGGEHLGDRTALPTEFVATEDRFTLCADGLGGDLLDAPRARRPHRSWRRIATSAAGRCSS